MVDAKEQIRAKLDLVEVIREFVPLRRGAHGFTARCPFHEEKSASFHVSPDRGLYHCFGCKASGDLFAFWMRVQGVGFKEALEELAERAGVELPDRHEADPNARADRERRADLEGRLRNVLELACQWYQGLLWRPPPEHAQSARRALDELRARGVAPRTAERYRLGYAPAPTPDSWNATVRHLLGRGCSPADIEGAGLSMPSKRREGEWVDFFRDRLMFTISDPRGRVVGFSGRDLSGDEKAPKYLSSPETPLFHKGSLIFGLHEARVALSKRNEAVLVEGNFDVVALAGAGIENVVAPLGTAFTLDQARMLRRSVEHVVSACDADRAGREATQKLWQVTEPAKLTVSVLDIGAADGKDADEWVRTLGAAGVRDRLARGAVPWIDWAALDGLCSDADDADLRKTASFLAQRCARIPERIERDVALRRVARLYGVPEDVLRGAAGITESPAAAAAAAAVPHEDRPLAPRPDSVPELTDVLLRAGLADPALLAGPVLDSVLTHLGSDLARAWLTAARAQWTEVKRVDGAALLALAADDEAARAYLSSVLVRAAEGSRDREQAHRAFDEAAKAIKKTGGATAARALRKQASLARAKGDAAEAERLMTAARQMEE